MNLSSLPHRLLPLLRGSAVALLLLGAAGCERNEIRVYQVRKDMPWKLPAGWREREAGQMRAAQFAVAATNGVDIDVSLIPIRGAMARPEMTADIVNIWRQQMQLEPVDGEALAKLAQKISVGREQGELYEMAGGAAAGDGAAKQRTLVAAVKADNAIWFIKMTGEDATVAQEKPAYLAFLQSLNLDAMPAPPQMPPHAASANQRESRPAPPQPTPQWTVPAGWEESPPTQMLLAKFVIAGQAQGRAEMTVSAFPGSVGGMLANINRWRGQLQIQPIDETELARLLTALDLPSGKAMLVDMNGTDSKTGQPARIIGAIQEREGLTWFYKLMGSDAVAAREKEAFVNFLKTVKYPNG